MKVKINLKKIMVFALFLMPCWQMAFGGKPANSTQLLKAKSIFNSPDWVFRENKGQLCDENHSQLNDIKYYGRQGSVNVYCKAGIISFVFTKAEHDDNVSEATGQQKTSSLEKSGKENIKPSKVTAFRAELQLLKANLNAEITPSGKQEYYENYYTSGDANRGITNVHTYNTITYKNIYRDIDMVLEAKPNGIEYSFIIHPGGDPTDIQLQWNGLDKIKALENGGIQYELPAPTFTETAPATYQNDKSIASSFMQSGRRISFKVANYDRNKDLVIDPGISWGTYYGGDLEDEATAITVDANKNVYVTGWTTSTANIATSGAYQTTISGSAYYGDAFVAKFSPKGDSLLWGTYYGGTNGASSAGIATDANSNVYITGNTSSSDGIATSGAYKTSITGSGNIYIAKFASTGSLSWGTYYGGGNYDNASGITVDRKDNVSITGFTKSTSGIATSGGYLTTLKANIAAFIAKFNSSGDSLLWGTYFGQTSFNYGYGISADANNNIYITGKAGSASGIATAGAYQTHIGNYFLAFTAKFLSSGKLDWGTYYGGNQTATGYGITTDANSNVYITGNTTSTDSIATSGAYQTSFGGKSLNDLGDAFVAKFDSSGSSLLWGTYYGGSSDDGANGIALDSKNNVWITGATYSSNGIATSGAYQTSNIYFNGTGFIAKFNSSGSSLLYGTYFGTGSGIVADADDNIYVTGNTQSTSGIATSGTYQSSYNGDIDAFVAKFDTLNCSTPANNAGSPQSLCSGYSTTLGASATNGHTYSWTSTPAGFSSTLSNPLVNPSVTTTYTLTETVTSGGCSASYSVVVTLIPSPNDSFTIGQSNTTVNCTPKNTGYSYYIWNFGDGNTSYVTKPSHTYSSNGSYWISLTVVDDISHCQASDSQMVTISTTGINTKGDNNISLLVSPNPFTHSANIQYTINRNSPVSASIYDANGKEVALLCDETQPPGKYEYIFDATKYNVAPGVYFLKMTVDGTVIGRKIVRVE